MRVYIGVDIHERQSTLSRVVGA